MSLAASLSLLAGFAIHASAHTGSHGPPPAGLASPADEVCPAGITTVIVQEADVVIKQVIEVDVHCPENTVLPIHDDVTITVTNAPTSIVTKVTCVHTAHTTFTETVAPTKTVDPPSKKCSSTKAASAAETSKVPTTRDPPAKPTTTSEHHSAETTGHPTTSGHPTTTTAPTSVPTTPSIASEPPTRPTPTFGPPALEVCPPIPEACAALRGLRGPQFAAAAPACYATLGDNLTDLIVDNLFLDLVFPSLTPGDDALDYIEEYFEENCLSELPESCTGLEDLDGEALEDALHMCEFQLGPWTTGPAGKCFEGATDRAVVTQCLDDAIFG